MRIEVIITTMNNDKLELIDKMNIKSDVILCNQSNYNDISIIEYNNRRIYRLTFNERGVGLNRNNGLMRSTSDICVFADDDLVYINNFESIIKQQYEENPKADVIVFNIFEKNSKRYMIKKKHKINYFNYMKYGAARLTVKRRSISMNGIYFNQNFGGGTTFSAGEDVLFLKECLDKGLNVIALPICIAELTNDRESTWFEGYTDKFFRDKGVLFYYISKKYYMLLILQFVVRKHKQFKNEKTKMQIIRLMIEGVNQGREM